MLLSVLLIGCLVDHDLYNQRRAQLTDDDADGYSEVEGDCNDADPTFSPAAREVCDGMDNDCDGDIDDADDDLDVSGFYADDDGDGHGGAPAPSDCSDSDLWVEQTGDCDDDDDDVSPDEEEVCNDGIDNDCDGGAGACRLAGEWSVATASQRIEAASAFDTLGSTFAVLGDINADAQSDVAISAAAGAEASVFIVSDLAEGRGIDASTPRISNDEGTLSRFGVTVAVAPRTSLFGEPAVVVGSRDRIVGYLLPLAATVTPAEADFSISLDGRYDADIVDLGPAAAVDSNADGIDELVAIRIGAGGASAVHLLTEEVWERPESILDASTRATLTSAGLITPSLGGIAGDLDGTGMSELCIPTPLEETGAGSTGLVHLISPEEITGSSELSAASTRIEGEAPGDGFGLGSCLSAGDLDEDGYDDLRIGATLAGRPGVAGGSVYLFYGPIRDHRAATDADLRIDGSAASDTFGLLHGEPGDFDGDGSVDLTAAAIQQIAGGPGKVHVFYGPFTDGTRSAGASDVTLIGEADGDLLGLSTFIGDTNADGRDDLLITSPMANDGDGAAYLFFGAGI